MRVRTRDAVDEMLLVPSSTSFQTTTFRTRSYVPFGPNTIRKKRRYFCIVLVRAHARNYAGINVGVFFFVKIGCPRICALSIKQTKKIPETKKITQNKTRYSAGESTGRCPAPPGSAFYCCRFRRLPPFFNARRLDTRKRVYLQLP